jgi:RNase P/RNase MRP subunit p29
MISDVSFDDLRSVAVLNDKIAVLDASSGVKVLNQNFEVTKEIAIDSDFGVNTKRTLDFVGENIIVSEGSNGAGVYDVATGNLIEYIPIFVNPEGVDSQDIVTNAVAINDDVILMANGGAGLCLSEEQGDNTDLVGIIELDASVNYVASKGDYIFAASGSKGLQIIKLNRPSESLVTKCANSPAYSGRARLVVDSGEVLAFRGSKRFNRIDVSGELLLCGSWTVANHININENALFELNGVLVVGRNHKRKNIVVKQDATFRVEGNLTIYGDLILEDGATIEFIGSDSVVNVFGRVNKSETAEVKGDFVDVRNRF